MTFLSSAGSYLATWIGRAGVAEAAEATWQTNANTAYDSGIWGTGNTWQSDYNTANALAAARLAAGAGGAPVVTSGTLSTTTPTGGAVWSGSSLTAPLTGHYVGYWFHQPNSSNTGVFNMHLRVAGGQVGGTFGYQCQSGNQDTYAGAVEFDATAGQVIDLLCDSFSGSNGSGSSGTFKITFIPTPNNPH